MLTRKGADIRDASGSQVERRIQRSPAGSLLAEKGNYRHFMSKEIHEQPEVVGHTLARYIDMAALRLKPFAWPADPTRLKRVTIVGCGTAYMAGLVAKYWIERWARLPVEIDVASAYRYREAPVDDGYFTIVVSQSGETADTLASLRYVKERGAKTVGVVNVPDSSIARLTDAAAPTLAGVEIGVASTKAFTCQLAVLAALALALGKARGMIDEAAGTIRVGELVATPGLLAEALKLEPAAENLAHSIARARDVLYLGRGTAYPLALEGALKLKELSYIHAEGYAAGELKHGPIALIDEAMPVIVIAPSDAVFEKTVSNMQEVAARGGRLILIGDRHAAEEAGVTIEHVLPMPEMAVNFAPIVYMPLCTFVVRKLKWYRIHVRVSGWADNEVGGKMRRFSGIAAFSLLAMAGAAAPAGGASAADQFVIGVSNTHIGNSWREEFVCSIKAEALASGLVSKIVLANREAGPSEQIADLRTLISAGVNAIIINPSDEKALNGVIKQAADKGIVVVAADQPVSAPEAYIVTGDQVTYAKVGAKWLFDQLKGKGDVYQMRGIDGAPGDSVRQTGFDAVLKDYPGIKVVATTFMDWSNEKAAQQMSAMLASGKHFDGVWTSGIDYTVIEAMKAAGKPFVPFVGADNNGFIKQLIDYKKDGLIGVAVSNSPAIGAAGLVVALDVLRKKPRDRVTTVPTAWYDNTTDENVEKLKTLYDPNVAPTDPVYGPEKDYGHFTAAQEKACKGPGE